MALKSILLYFIICVGVTFMDIIKKGFGEQLKAIRKFKNMTQEELADSVGINLRQLARIEAGESFISSETLLKICITLKISPKILFDFSFEEEYLATGTDNIMHLSVVKNGNVIHLVPNMYTENSQSVDSLSFEDQNFNKKMSMMAKRLQKEIKVDEIRDGSVVCTNIYYPDGHVEREKDSAIDNYEMLKNKISNICNDENKLEFMNLAYDSIFDKKSLDALKILIKGIELMQN